MKAEDFLNAGDFTLDTENTIEVFDPKDLETFNDVNIESIKFIKSEVLDALLEASTISDKTDTPSTPSFQPLNEAGILTSGESLDKSAIGALTNNSLSIQEDAMDSLVNTNNLSTDISSDMTAETFNNMKEAQETLASGVKSLANGAELANSGIKFAGGSIKFAGNNISLGSDTSVHTTSPIITTVSDVDNRQAKTIQETTNQKTLVAKTTFTQIEGLQSTVAKNSMKTVTNSSIQISNYSSNTAVEKSITNSNQIENVAGTYIKNRSQNLIVNEASNTISTQSPNISITAAQGAKSSLSNKEESENNTKELKIAEDGTISVKAKDPSGKIVKFTNIDPNNNSIEKWKSIGGLEGQEKSNIAPVQTKQGGGNLSILADGEGGTVSIINKNMVMSSTGNQNVSVGGNINQVAFGSLTNSGAFINTEADVGLTMSSTGYIRNQSGITGTFIAGGFTFAGFRFPALKKFIDKVNNVPLEIREIPALSSIPLVVSIKTLQDCLPKKYTEPSKTGNPNFEPTTEQEELDKTPSEIAAPTAKQARQRQKTSAIPTGKVITNAEGGIIQASGTANSKKVDGNTMLSSDASPTDPTPVAKNKLTSAAAVFKGGSDVYPLDEEQPFDLFERQGKEILDPDVDQEAGGEQLIKNYITSLSNLSIKNTITILNSKPEFEELLTNDLNYIKQYYYNKLLSDSSLLTEETRESSESREFINGLILLPEVKEILDRIETEILNKSSIGGVMSFITSAYSNVSSSISIASNILDQVNNKNAFGVLKNASSIAKNLTDNDIFTDINTIIDSSSDISNVYKQVNNLINNPDTSTGELTNKLSFEKLSTVITEGLNVIGINNLSKATAVAQILNNIKNSEEYKKDGLTNNLKKQLILNIVDQAGIEYDQAENLYNNAEGVINNILQGNIEGLTKDTQLQNLLGFFIGSSNAAILKDIQGIYLKGKSTIQNTSTILQQGEELYQDGKDLYSTIQSIPSLVGLMNQYEIPLLNQAKIVLECIELVSKVQEIIAGIKQASKSISQFGKSIEGTFDAFNDLITTDKKPTKTSLELITNDIIKGEIAPAINIPNTALPPTNLEIPIINELNQQPNKELIINNTSINNINCSIVTFSHSINTNDSSNPSEWTENITAVEAVDLIEKLPRLTQIYNSIKEFPNFITDNSNINMFPELSNKQINAIQQSEILTPLSNCYIAPKLNLVEASVDVIEIKDNIMLFKMSNLALLTYNNKNVTVSNNIIVQIYVEEFVNIKTSQTMTTLRTPEFFSPYVFSFKTSVFDNDKNLGIAHLMNSQNRIHLQTFNGVTYNYSITDIGKKLKPIIKDSYIVA